MSFDEITKYKHLLQAGEKSCNSSRWKASNQMFEINILRYTSRNKKNLLSGKFKYHGTNNFMLHERGKWRKICAHHIADRQVQKTFCRYELLPAVQNRILKSNAASQTGKGTDFMLKRFRADLAHAYKICGGRKFYVFVYDFHDYFGSIPHDTALANLEKDIADERSMALMRSYTDIFPGEKGYGIGGEPSQIIAVTYPSSIDRMLACDTDVIRSGRYMDDGYAIVRTREAARGIEQKFRNRAERLGLTINEKRIQIYNMDKDVVTFLKKRTSITENGKIIMRLVRKNVQGELRRIKYQKRQYDAGLMPFEAVEQSMKCWMEYASKYCAYKARIRVLDCYARTFGVPWERARKLLK